MEPDSSGHAERPAVTAGRRGARHRSGTTRQMTRAVTPASPAETPLRSPGAVVSDRASFDQVRGRLLGIGYRITGTWADAEDAADEALARLVALDPSSAPENPEAWLTTVATRLCLDRLRRRKREDYIGS